MDGAHAIVKARKAALREHMDHVLADMSDLQVQLQSDNITQQVLQHPKFLAAGSISLYLSTGREVRTTEILRAALSLGKACYVPRYSAKSGVMDMVRLHSMQDYEGLPLTRWNIRQPRVSEQRESVFDVGRLDVVLLPGVAFSRQGARLGHGRGYYDGFLSRCRRELPVPPWSAALALTQQMLPDGDIPMEGSDQRLDDVITSD